MKGAALLLVALAAFAGLCSVEAGMPAMNYQGGYSCGGKIAKLDCYAPDGVIKGLVYHNTNDGEATAICDYPFVNGGPAWTGNALELDSDESIISVTACRGGYYGYSKLEVTTDKGRTWSCGGGNGAYSYKPPTWNGCGGMSMYKTYGCYQPYDYSTKYNKWSHKLKTYRGLLAAEDVAADANEGRQLQADVDASEDFYHKKSWGWGWNGGCQTYRSPRQPKWSTCGGSKCNNWWTGKSRRYGSYGTVANSFYYRSWGHANKFYRYNMGGKPHVYYHSRTLYNKYSNYCASNSCNYVPKCYYDESYPLASFSGICDKAGYIYNLYGFCWNDNYTPPTPPNALVVEFILESDAGLPCVNIDGTPIDINAVLGQMMKYFSIAQPGLVKEITYYSTGYKCTPGGAGTNATTVVALGFVPGDGKTVADLLAFFQSVPILPGTTDVCSFPEVTDPSTGISFGPCVAELDSAIPQSYDGAAVVSTKKKVTVKQAMERIAESYQYTKKARKYANNKMKHVPAPYSTYPWGYASYAKGYLKQFPKGHKRNMSKFYGQGWRKKMQKTYSKKKSTKKGL